MIKYSKVSASEIDLLRETSLNHPHHFIRRKALSQLLRQHDVNHAVIEEVLGVCENTLRSYCCGYERNGIDFITSLNFRKPTSELIPFKEIVLDYLKKTPPASIKQACSEIGELTGVHRQESQMSHYLKKIGACCRQVCIIPGKVDVQKQKEFKEQELEPRLKEAEAGEREVFFVDAAHFVLQAFLGKVWSLCRVFIRSPSGRQRFNVLGALNAVTKEIITVVNNTYITSTEVCLLLKNIAIKNVQSYEARSEKNQEMDLLETKLNLKETSTAFKEVDFLDVSESAELKVSLNLCSIEQSTINLAIGLTLASNKSLSAEFSGVGGSESTAEKAKIKAIAINSDQEPDRLKETTQMPGKKERKLKKDKDAIKKEKEAAIIAQAKKYASDIKVKTPVTVYLDNVKYQRCLMVIALAKELGIDLVFLPSYSPNLNLIERLWKFTKKGP